MNIANMYDVTWKIENPAVASIIYKINKLIVNLVYPKVVKPVFGIDESSNVIVSLTSFPERINTVWITISTILHQTIKPGKIILWLADEQFPKGEEDLPKKLLELKKYGLTIRFCDNLYPHKKYYYTMLENPNSVVITVDDDVFYPEHLIEDLLMTSQNNPGAICCTWAHRIVINGNGKVAPYEQWEHCVRDNNYPEIKLMPVGIGGVLYPPHTLDERVFEKNKLIEISLKTDDLWLKTMEILKKTKAVRIPKGYRQTYFTVVNTQNTGLYKKNVGELRNNKALELLFDNYPHAYTILEEE